MRNGIYHGDDVLTVGSIRQASGADVCHEVAVVVSQSGPFVTRREIRDDVAMAIVAGWQSPGSVGRHFAQLASTGTVRLEDFADDLSASFDECRRSYGPLSPEMSQLNCLATWALTHPGRH